MRSTTSFAILALAFLPIQNAGAWGQFAGGHHPDYNPHFAHRDPVIVHRTYVAGGGGCVGCGVGAAAVAGLVGGAILGAAIAGGAAAPPPTVVEQAPPVVVEAPPQQVIVQAAPPPGGAVASLPPGCASMNVNGGNYFQCGATWYQPYVGGNGVYYVVVPTP